MADEKALVTLPEKASALEFYKTPNGLDAFIQQVREKVDGIVYDMSTAKGRDECRSDAAKVARSKTAIEALGKQLAADAKALPKLIDTERARAWDELEKLQEQVRAPLTAYEQAEEKRKATHTAFIVGIKELAAGTPEDSADRLGYLQAIVVDDSLEEFKDEAEHALRRALETVSLEHAAHVKAVADAQELAKLRAEAAEREAKAEADRLAREAADKARQAADDARRQAEDKARQDREDSIRREAEAKTAAANAALELQLANERAARQALEAQQRADAAVKAAQDKAAADAEYAVAAERKRVADAAQAEADATKRREENRAHRAKINREAVAKFVEHGFDPDTAKRIVTVIAQGSITHIDITY